MNTKYLTYNEIEIAAAKLALQISRDQQYRESLLIYPATKNAIAGAFALTSELHRFQRHSVIVNNPAEANIFFDLVTHTNETAINLCEQYLEKPFYALFDRLDSNEYLVFPWENDKAGIADGLKAFIIENSSFNIDFSLKNGIAEFQYFLAEVAKRHTLQPVDVIVREKSRSTALKEIKNIHSVGLNMNSLLPIEYTVSIVYRSDEYDIPERQLPALIHIYCGRISTPEIAAKDIAQCLNHAINPYSLTVSIEAKIFRENGVCDTNVFFDAC